MLKLLLGWYFTNLVSSCYVDIDEVQSMTTTRYGQNAPHPPPTSPRIVPEFPPRNFPMTATYEPLPTPINERRRLPPDSSTCMYTELLHQDEKENMSLGGATTNAPVNLRDVNLTVNITVDNETELFVEHSV